MHATVTLVCKHRQRHTAVRATARNTFLSFVRRRLPPEVLAPAVSPLSGRLGPQPCWPGSGPCSGCARIHSPTDEPGTLAHTTSSLSPLCLLPCRRTPEPAPQVCRNRTLEPGSFSGTGPSLLHRLLPTRLRPWEPCCTCTPLREVLRTYYYFTSEKSAPPLFSLAGRLVV